MKTYGAVFATGRLFYWWRKAEFRGNGVYERFRKNTKFYEI